MESIHQDFIAWSLYTGPSDKSFMQNPSHWITGTWQGGKQNSSDSARGLKADLDARIELVVKVFEKAVLMYKTRDRHFVLPEFFFHCGHGPYPLVVESVDGDKIDAFQYVIECLGKKFEECIMRCDPNDKNCYNIVIGSMLTSNQDDYDGFLQSEPIKTRKKELDRILLRYRYRAIFFMEVSMFLTLQYQRIYTQDYSEKFSPSSIEDIINSYTTKLPEGFTIDDIVDSDWRTLFLNPSEGTTIDLSTSNLLIGLKNIFGFDFPQSHQNSSNVTWERNRHIAASDIPILKSKAGDVNQTTYEKTDENSQPGTVLIQQVVILDKYLNMIKEEYQFDIIKFMDQNKSNPLCTVRNRGAYFYFRKCTTPGDSTPKRRMQVFRYEKQNNSSIDLTMGSRIDNSPDNALVLGDVIAEWMCNYPAYSLYWGDKNVPLDFHPSDNYQYAARFTPFGVSGVDFGVEVCLDHSFQRLRRTVGMTSSNSLYSSTQNYPLCKQLITSCGSQIQNASIAADSNSVVFHADGGEAMVESYDGNDGNWRSNAKTIGDTITNIGIFNGVYSLYASSTWKDVVGKTYFSHSQLAFTTDSSSMNGFNNAGINNDVATTYNGTTENPSNRLTDSYEVTVLPLKVDTKLDGDTPFEGMDELFKDCQWLFAAGVGELHHYRPMTR